jgi:hypothetical protein
MTSHNDMIMNYKEFKADRKQEVAVQADADEQAMVLTSVTNTVPETLGFAERMKNHRKTRVEQTTLHRQQRMADKEAAVQKKAAELSENQDLAIVRSSAKKMLKTGTLPERSDVQNTPVKPFDSPFDVNQIEELQTASLRRESVDSIGLVVSMLTIGPMTVATVIMPQIILGWDNVTLILLGASASIAGSIFTTGAALNLPQRKMIRLEKAMIMETAPQLRSWIFQRHNIVIDDKTAQKLSRITLAVKQGPLTYSFIRLDKPTHTVNFKDFNTGKKYTAVNIAGSLVIKERGSHEAPVTQTIKQLINKNIVIHSEPAITPVPDAISETHSDILNRLALVSKYDLGVEAAHTVERIQGSMEVAVTTHRKLVTLDSSEQDLQRIDQLMAALLVEVDELISQQREDMNRQIAIETEYTLSHQQKDAFTS